MYDPSVGTKLCNSLKQASVKRGSKNVLKCTLISSFFLLPIKKNTFWQIHVHAMYCSFQQTYGVLYLMKNMASLRSNWGGMRDKPKDTWIGNYDKL